VYGKMVLSNATEEKLEQLAGVKSAQTSSVGKMTLSLYDRIRSNGAFWEVKSAKKYRAN